MPVTRNTPKFDALRKQMSEFVKPLVGTLDIPGTHRSGLSNNEVLAIRAKEGRDFAMVTVQMTQYLRKELAQRFRGIGRMPTVDEVKDLTSKLYVNYIANVRVLHGGGDIILPPLTHAYAKKKRQAGHGGDPIGVFDGKWLAALRKARLVFPPR